VVVDITSKPSGTVEIEWPPLFAAGWENATVVRDGLNSNAKLNSLIKTILCY
jgi:hypothetical protein